MREYTLAYLVIGAVFAIAMAMINERSARRSGSKVSRVPVSVYAMISLAWPVAAVAFAYGLLAHLFRGTATDDGAS